MILIIMFWDRSSYRVSQILDEGLVGLVSRLENVLRTMIAYNWAAAQSMEEKLTAKSKLSLVSYVTFHRISSEFWSTII